MVCGHANMLLADLRRLGAPVAPERQAHRLAASASTCSSRSAQVKRGDDARQRRYPHTVDLLPNDADFLTVFGGVLAAGTALIGILVSFSQFTGAARARRTVDWATEALTMETNPARKLVLDRLRLRCQGYLVASRYVPWWRFSEAALWMLLTPVVIVIASSSGRAAGSVALSALAGLVNMAVVGRRAVRLYSERIRVAHQFVAGGRDVEPVQIDLLHQMEGGTRREFTLGFAVAAAVMATGALVAWALTGGGGSARWLWPFVGLFAFWNSVRLIHSYAASAAELRSNMSSP